MPRGRVSGLSCGRVGQTHPEGPGPLSRILGELASHFVYSSKRENFLFVKEKKPWDIKVFLQNSVLMA